jgi:cysteine synthase B
MIGAARGYPVKLCMPENVTPERKRILRAYGAELVLTDPMEGSDGAIRRVREIYQADPDRYYYPDQYSNPANWQAHYQSTGPEILSQTDGGVTHFVAGLGTSGTFVGTGRFLRERAPHVQLISVQPDTALHGLEGMKHMETAMVPGIYDSALADVDMRVGTEESYLLTKRLALEEGLLVGISSGAALAAGLRVADSIETGLVVMVFADGGEKYLSERFWEEPPEGSFVSGVN